MEIRPDSISFWILAAIAGFFKWLENMGWNYSRETFLTRSVFNLTYSWRARGSFCICSKIIRIAGSRKIAWTSGSAIALLRTSSGFELVAIIHALYPSSASCESKNVSCIKIKAPWLTWNFGIIPKRLDRALKLSGKQSMLCCTAAYLEGFSPYESSPWLNKIQLQDQRSLMASLLISLTESRFKFKTSFAIFET